MRAIIESFRSLRTCGFALLGWLLCVMPVVADTLRAAADLDVRLIALNDFHGYIEPPDDTFPAPDPHDPAKRVMLKLGGAANLASLVRQLQADHPLNAVVAAGDLVGASPFASAMFHDEPSIAVMNAIGLSLSSVGNHEFDHGRAELLRLQNGGCFPHGERGRDTCVGGHFGGARFHYLAANVVDRASGTPLFAPYEIKTFATPGARSLRIAFIGLVLKNTATMVLRSGIAGLEFRDEAATANALVPQLQQQGVDAIVLLIHQGGSTSGSFDDHRCADFSGALLPILDALDPAIRVIVSGHTHQAYVCRRGDRLVTSAGSYGRLLTAIDLSFNAATGTLHTLDAHNLAVVNSANADAPDFEVIPPDAAIASLLQPYHELSRQRAEQVVGHLTASLSRTPNAAGETTLGDVVADSMLDAARKDGAVIAFTNIGGLREDLIPQAGDGAIRYSQLYAALPFGNALLAMDLSGAQLRALLRQQRRDGPPRPLQISRGFSYAWSDGRLDDASVRLHGQPLIDGRTYRVVVNQFLAEGGDGYTLLTEGRRRRVVGHDLAAALSYFAAHDPASPVPQDRIACAGCAAP